MQTITDILEKQSVFHRTYVYQKFHFWLQVIETKFLSKIGMYDSHNWSPEVDLKVMAEF